MMKTVPALLTALLLSGVWCSGALAKLPPPTDEAKAKAAEAAAKTAWSGKVSAYQLCQVQNKIAASYRAHAAASGAAASGAAGTAAPAATPACADPGPFAYHAEGAVPMEAAGAHSPPQMATAPPAEQASAAAGPPPASTPASASATKP